MHTKPAIQFTGLLLSLLFTACSSQPKYPELITRGYNKEIEAGYEAELEGDFLEAQINYRLGYKKLYPRIGYKRTPRLGSFSPEFFLARLIQRNATRYKTEIIGTTGDVLELQIRTNRNKQNAMIDLANRADPMRNPNSTSVFPGIVPNPRLAASLYIQLIKTHSYHMAFANRCLQELVQNHRSQLESLKTEIANATKIANQFNNLCQSFQKSPEDPTLHKQLLKYNHAAVNFLIFATSDPKTQIEAQKLLPKLVKKPHPKPNARPDIWQNWYDKTILRANL